MEFIRAGFRALEECWRFVIGLVLVTAGLNLAASALNYSLQHDLIGPVDEGTKRAIDLVSDLVLVGTISAAQAIAYGYIGKHLDRPLYKIAGWQDAARRFFGLWFTLNLIHIAIGYVGERVAADNPAMLQVILCLWLLYSLISVPIAACMMFGGRVAWREAGTQLMPLSQLPQGTLAVLFLAFFQFTLQIGFGDVALPGEAGAFMWVLAGPALMAILVILEVTIFAAVWEMCRTYRDMDHGDDFDF